MNARRTSGRTGRSFRCRAVLIAGVMLLTPVLFAQTGQTRFVNNTPFTVHIVAGSGRAEVCTLAPHSTGMGQGVFGQAEYFYPVFEVPLTEGFRLKDTRPADVNYFYQIDDRRNSATIVIDAVPPLGDRAAYIVLINSSRTGGVSMARTASSRLTRLDGGSDNVNAGEYGVFRITPRDESEIRIASPVDVAFPSIEYRPGHRYVFTFDGKEAALVDARPLHTIGLPLPAAVVFDDGVPEAGRDALRAALDEGLAAHKAPLRVEPETGEAGETGDTLVSYTLTIALTITKQTVTFPMNRDMYSGEVTVTLTRNGPGNGRVIVERAAAVTELSEDGIYRAVRQFLTRDRQLYEEIGELDK